MWRSREEEGGGREEVEEDEAERKKIEAERKEKKTKIYRKKKQKKNRDSLPKVHVGVVEDVGVRVEVVEALGRQHHADVVAAVEERDHLEEELLGRDLFFC